MAALDGHRAFLHRLSPVRSRLVLPLVSASCPFAADADGAFARGLAALAHELDGVLAALRRSAHLLLPSCVVPSRSSAGRRAAVREAGERGQRLNLPMGHGLRSSADPLATAA